MPSSCRHMFKWPELSLNEFRATKGYGLIWLRKLVLTLPFLSLLGTSTTSTFAILSVFQNSIIDIYKSYSIFTIFTPHFTWIAGRNWSTVSKHTEHRNAENMWSFCESWGPDMHWMGSILYLTQHGSNILKCIYDSLAAYALSTSFFVSSVTHACWMTPRRYKFPHPYLFLLYLS